MSRTLPSRSVKLTKSSMVGRVVADDKFSRLAFGMVWIGEDAGKRIGEHSYGIIKSDTVLAKVG